MNAADVMTRAVVTVAPNARVADAIRLMLDQRISGLPVVDASGRLVGMLTEGDLLRRAETGTERQRPAWLNFLRDPAKHAGDYVLSHGRIVDEVMTRDAISVAEHTPLDELVDVMERKHVKRVAVVADDRLVGIVSRTDLLRALSKAMDQPTADAGDDGAVCDQVIAALAGQAWGGRGQVTVVVTDGVAYLEGVIYDLRERDAMRVAAENVVGVREVQDHLNCVDPNTGMMFAA